MSGKMGNLPPTTFVTEFDDEDEEEEDEEEQDEEEYIPQNNLKTNVTIIDKDLQQQT